MAKKRKKVKKESGPGKHVKLLAAANKEIENVRLHVAEQRGALQESRTSVSRLTRRLEEALKTCGEMNAQIEEMYRESYRLVKCLTATRGAWEKCRAKIAANEKTWTINMKAAVADVDAVEKSMGESDGAWVAGVEAKVEAE